eukprot:220717_1
MDSKISVVVCGGINIDRTFAVNQLPRNGETVMGKTAHTGVGGKAANTAVCCSKVDATTSFIGAFGDDSYTAMLENEMKQHNVNTDTCYRLTNSKIPSGAAYIFLLPNGDNSIVVVPSANACWPDALTKTQIDAIAKSDCVLLQREVPEAYNIRIAKIAKQNGVKVVLDAGGEDTKISKELLLLTDILSPNEIELQRLCRHYDPNTKYDVTRSTYSTIRKIKLGCAMLQSLNKNMAVLVKRGGKGSMFIDAKGRILRQSALKVSKSQIQDTTGAGDCFTGSFVVEWIRQQKVMGIWNKAESEKEKKTDDETETQEDEGEAVRLECIGNAMKFANAAAGLSVQQKGTIASIPSLIDVVRCVLQTQI